MVQLLARLPHSKKAVLSENPRGPLKRKPLIIGYFLAWWSTWLVWSDSPLPRLLRLALPPVSSIFKLFLNMVAADSPDHPIEEPAEHRENKHVWEVRRGFRRPGAAAKTSLSAQSSTSPCLDLHRPKIMAPLPALLTAMRSERVQNT